MAGPQPSRSLVSTDRHCRRRIDHRSHWRLALLGSARLLLLNLPSWARTYAGFPKAHESSFVIASPLQSHIGRKTDLSKLGQAESRSLAERTQWFGVKTTDNGSFPDDWKPAGRMLAVCPPAWLKSQ